LAVHLIQIGRTAYAGGSVNVAHSSRDPQPNHLASSRFSTQSMSGLDLRSRERIAIDWVVSSTRIRNGLHNLSTCMRIAVLS